MTFGLTEDGFKRKLLAEIKASLETRMNDEFKPIDTSPQSVVGQFIGVISEIADEIWQNMELIHLSQSPDSAEGVNLDNVAALTNNVRLDATSSSAKIVVFGTQGTTIPAGSLIRQSGTGELFQVSADVDIDVAASVTSTVSVNTLADATLYTVSITRPGEPTTNYDYTSAVPPNDANDILSGLKTEIDNDTAADLTVTIDALAETMTIVDTDGVNVYGITVSTELDIDTFGSQGDTASVNEDDIAVPIGTLTTIETPVSGWDSVDNIVAGQEGRDIETDDEFRTRRKLSLSVAGATTVPAIEARLVSGVPEVSSAFVIENRDGTVDPITLLPGHSFEAVVQAPTGLDVDGVEIDQKIANQIWEVKPAGIQPFGDITKIVTDSQGVSQPVSFSRPSVRYVHMRVTIDLYDEEVFPDIGGIATIAQDLVDFGNNLTLGQDLIFQRFFDSVFNTEGVLEITVFEWGIEDNPTDVPSDRYTGTNDATGPNRLIDTSKNFLTPGNEVIPGHVVKNLTDGTQTFVISVDTNSPDTIIIAKDIFTSTGKSYSVGNFGNGINIPLGGKETGIFDIANTQVTKI